MQELFFTILVIWLLFKVMGSSGGSVKTFTFNTQNNYKANPEEKKQEGEVKIEHTGTKKTNNNTSNEGDYVDYEEIK